MVGGNHLTSATLSSEVSPGDRYRAADGYDEDRIEQLLSERLLQGFTLLEDQACPVCSTPLILQEPSSGDEDTCTETDEILSSTTSANRVNTTMHSQIQPISGVPFCVACPAHVITEEVHVKFIEQHQEDVDKLRGTILVALSPEKQKIAERLKLLIGHAHKRAQQSRNGTADGGKTPASLPGVASIDTYYYARPQQEIEICIGDSQESDTDDDAAAAAAQYHHSSGEEHTTDSLRHDKYSMSRLHNHSYQSEHNNTSVSNVHGSKESLESRLHLSLSEYSVLEKIDSNLGFQTDPVQDQDLPTRSLVYSSGMSSRDRYETLNSASASIHSIQIIDHDNESGEEEVEVQLDGTDPVGYFGSQSHDDNNNDQDDSSADKEASSPVLTELVSESNKGVVTTQHSPRHKVKELGDNDHEGVSSQKSSQQPSNKYDDDDDDCNNNEYGQQHNKLDGGNKYNKDDVWDKNNPTESYLDRAYNENDAYSDYGAQSHSTPSKRRDPDALSYSTSGSGKGRVRSVADSYNTRNDDEHDSNTRSATNSNIGEDLVGTKYVDKEDPAASSQIRSHVGSAGRGVERVTSNPPQSSNFDFSYADSPKSPYSKKYGTEIDMNQNTLLEIMDDLTTDGDIHDDDHSLPEYSVR
jgi:hypothetical protein